MNIALWIFQSLLAFVFCAAGGTKLAKDRAALLLDKRMAWAGDFSSTQIKLIGLAEVLGAIALILPRALHIMAALTPIAGVALAILMIGAAATHLRRKEAPAVPIVLALLTAGVAIGRFVLG